MDYTIFTTECASGDGDVLRVESEEGRIWLYITERGSMRPGLFELTPDMARDMVAAIHAANYGEPDSAP